MNYHFEEQQQEFTYAHTSNTILGFMIFIITLLIFLLLYYVFPFGLMLLLIIMIDYD